MKEFIRFIKFGIISASAGGIQIGTFTLFSEVFKFNYWVAYLVSLLLSIVWNYTINRKYTFKSNIPYKTALLFALLFYAVFTPLSTIGGNALVGSGVNKYIVEIGSMVLNFVLEFFYDRYFVFRKRIDNNVKPKEENNI